MIIISVLIMFIGLFSAVMLSNINPDKAFYLLIEKLMPPGLVGLGYAGMLSVILSSVDSLLIGGSTIVSREFNFRRTISVARIITLFLGIIAAVVAFIFPNVLNLALFGSFLMLSLTPALLFGLYSKKANTKQALISIIGAPIVLVIFSLFVYKISFVPAVIFGIIPFFIKLKD